MIMRQWGNHLCKSEQVCNSRATLWYNMISNTIWSKRPAEWSHLGSDDRHQRRRRLRTSSQGGKPTLWVRADAFFSPFVLRMLCLGGLAWYWVLGVGPTGYTESRQQPDELRRESWTRLPPAHGFLLRHTRKHWPEKVSRNRNFRNIFQIPQVQIIINIKYYSLNERTNLGFKCHERSNFNRYSRSIANVTSWSSPPSFGKLQICRSYDWPQGLPVPDGHAKGTCCICHSIYIHPPFQCFRIEEFHGEMNEFIVVNCAKCT